MDASEGVADLHMHTTASDGTCSVADRLSQATERNLESIAITDHDVVSPDLNGRVGHNGDLECITGVEVRADVRDTKVELLGYYLDPTDDRLQAVLERVRGYRRDRNRAMVERLDAVTDHEFSYEDLRRGQDEMLGRPHLATVLVEAGVVDSIGAAFEAYLGDDGSAFVPMERIPAGEAIEALQGAGAVVSLAHPGRIRAAGIEAVEGIVEDLVAAGLDAIEVPYPYAEAPNVGYADVSTEDAAAFAERFDLLWTGGSDCHGPGSGKFRIGEVRLAREHLDALRELADQRRPL